METRNSASPQTANFHLLTQNFTPQDFLCPPSYSLKSISSIFYQYVIANLITQRAGLCCTGAGRLMNAIVFPRLFCSLPARIKHLFSLPRSVFVRSPASPNFCFFHILLRYTTCGKQDSWTSCEFGVALEVVKEFGFMLKKLFERVWALKGRVWG